MKKQEFKDYCNEFWRGLPKDDASQYECYNVEDKLRKDSYISGYLDGRGLTGNLYPEDYKETLMDIIDSSEDWWY